jgi:V/A-type H+-transporting ATPase subunit E
MKKLESEQDALKKITDYLLEETLEPAKTEAAKIVEESKAQAKEIIEQAQNEQNRLIAQTKERLVNEERSFRSTLNQGVEQSIESLKQKILKDLFSPVLQQLVDKEMQKPQVIASFIQELIKAIDKEGLSLNLEAFIPANANAAEINTLLTKEVLNKLKNQTVTLGKMNSGVEVKMLDKKVTIEMTGKALQESLMTYLRQELRELIFVNENKEAS